jgi:transcriptional regulator with XRE-family HTH domain
MDESQLAALGAAVAARLRAERARLDLSLARVAERSGVAVMSVSRYENGKLPTVAALYKLAAAYGVEATALLPPMATVDDLKRKKGKGGRT